MPVDRRREIRKDEDTVLPGGRVRFLAKVARFCVLSREEAPDDNAARQMLAVGIRQLHDNAQSFRGAGKYLGHSVWSMAALDVLEQNEGRVPGITDQLSHEHVFPVMKVVEILFALSSSAPLQDYEEVIECNSVVAILTRSEDRKLSATRLRNQMPLDWNGNDLWARLRAIDIYDQLRPNPALQRITFGDP